LSSRRVLLAWLALFASGCGFQFRTAPDLEANLGPTWIETNDRYSPFYRELQTTFRRGRVQLVSTPADARTIVRILADDTGRRLLSVTARNVPAEYEVYYRVRFAVTRDGTEAVPVEQLSLARDYAFDETRVLGKSGEEDSIRQVIAEDLVRLVTRRLAAIRQSP
jgi:LPS-assembly lipoprotein